MFSGIGYDRTARRLLITGGVLVLAVLLAVVVSGLLSPAAAVLPTPVPPSPSATRTPRPTPAPPVPRPTTAVAQLDTPLPTDTAAPRPPTPLPVATAPAASPAAGATARPGPAGAAPYLTPLERPIIYSALGASDTVGVGAAHPDQEAWPAVIAARLPVGTRFTRFAQGGMTLADSLRQEVAPAIASKPTLVTVWLAANDFTRQVPLTTYQQQLHALLDKLTTETRAQIVLLNLPDLSLVIPAARLPGGPDQVRTLVQTWNVTIGATVAPYGDRVLLVDLFPATARVTVDSTLLSGDSWHPSTAGYAALADLVLQQMQQAGLLPAR